MYTAQCKKLHRAVQKIALPKRPKIARKPAPMLDLSQNKKNALS
jgi:hypothetical protein